MLPALRKTWPIASMPCWPRRPRPDSRQEALAELARDIVRFRAVHRCCFLGLFCSSLSNHPLVVKLHCAGLQHFGEREGLLSALGSCTSGCPSCFADASERARGGGGQPVLRSLCARSRGCGCFCLRLDFQVAVSVRGSQGTWVLSAFSTRTLPSTGVPARRVQAGGLLREHIAWHSCMSAALGRRGFFVLAFWGAAFLSGALVLSCLHCVGLQQFGERPVLR